MGEMRFIEALREGLREEMESDSSVFLIGQDIGVNGGVFRVTDGLQAQFGPERVIDSPLAESGQQSLLFSGYPGVKSLSVSAPLR